MVAPTHIHSEDIQANNYLTKREKMKRKGKREKGGGRGEGRGGEGRRGGGEGEGEKTLMGEDTLFQFRLLYLRHVLHQVLLAI